MDVCFSSSRSAASRAPNAITSSFRGEVAVDCWRAVIVEMDSSYFRRHFPVLNAKIRICLSGKEKVANLSPSREIVRVEGTDFACALSISGVFLVGGLPF